MIGDTVNIAARVESLTKLHGVDILLTGAVVERAPGVDVRALGPASLRGREQPACVVRAGEPPSRALIAAESSPQNGGVLRQLSIARTGRSARFTRTPMASIRAYAVDDVREAWHCVAPHYDELTFVLETATVGLEWSTSISRTATATA